MAEGRTQQAVKAWLADRPDAWPTGVEVVAMDGFTGYKSAATEEVPAAVVVMDPFHLARLAGDAVDGCRQRTQQATCGHRGRAGDPPYQARRTLLTGADLLTQKQQQSLDAVFAADAHVAAEATWGLYQRMIAAYRDPERREGKTAMTAVIASLKAGVPAGLIELQRLGRILNRRAADILAQLQPTQSVHGPTEAINGSSEFSVGGA